MELTARAQTTHEMRFLRDLGRVKGHVNPLGRENLLRNYINAAPKRDNWLLINKDRVLGYANGELARISGIP